MPPETSAPAPASAPAAPAVPVVDPVEAAARETWFTETPDPWRRIVVLEFGGDRSFASDIEQVIRHAEPQQQPALETRLLDALARPELTDAGRLFVCRMLGYVGSAACVPKVAPLLEDVHTSDVARLALDGIADPSVDAAYRGALPKLRGRAKAGLIGSIAMRGGKDLAAELQRISVDATETPEVRHAAERALARLQQNA